MWKLTWIILNSINTSSLTSLCTRLQLEVSCYRFNSIPLCSGADQWNHKHTHTHTHTVFSQTSGFMNGGFREDSDCEELLLSRWVCVLWRADRAPSCCALWENSVNGQTCPLQWQHTHTELPPGTTAVLQVYYCSRRLMISHPLRIEVTETLIQDSLIIASGYFYLHSTCTLEVRSLRQNFVFVPVFFFYFAFI